MNQRRSPTAPRRGAALFEIAVSTIMLVAVVTLIGKLAVADRRQQQRAVQESTATAELASLMEQVTALPWPEINAGAADDLRLSPMAEAKLADCQAAVSTQETDDDLPGKRVMVELSWASDPEAPRRTRSLATWVYRSEAPPE